MTGEKRDWYRLAFRLGFLVSDLKRQITYSEFLNWQVILAEEEQQAMKAEYYQAQIATEVVRGRIMDPGKVKLDDFLIRFEKAPEKRADSKSIWAAHLHMKI